jgi:hypothetical protein
MKTTHLYYLTTDPVNAQEAEGLASAEGIELRWAEPRDLPRLERERAGVILDWDHLPPEDRSHLLNGRTVQLVGVHGRNLGDRLPRFLPHARVAVSRRFDTRFLAKLAR